MAIKNTAIQNINTDIFTCPGSLPVDPQEHAVTCMIFCNTSGSDATVNLHVVPRNEIAADANKVINALNIPASETFTFDTEKIILETGDRLVAVASNTNRLVVTVSTIRVS
jgi:hypothetical protein